MTTDNKCGTCTACCRVYAIPEFDKPSGKWCEHCKIGEGCKIYEQRPKRCIEFECVWLQAQREMEKPFGIELRPDKCKVVFSMSTNKHVMTAVCMPGRPEAWRNPQVRALINQLHRAGVSVAISEPRSTRHLLLRPDGTSKIVEMTEPDENGMQWTVGEERLT